MANKCEFIEECGFLKNYSSHMETIKEAWVALYCDDAEVSEMCERKIFRLGTGHPPVDNLAPTGDLI